MSDKTPASERNIEQKKTEEYSISEMRYEITQSPLTDEK